MNHKELIFCLIKDDLRNQTLVHGLNALGLNAGEYCLGLSETIFYLLGYKESTQTEELYEKYLMMVNSAIEQKKPSCNDSLDTLAQTIYNDVFGNRS